MWERGPQGMFWRMYVVSCLPQLSHLLLKIGRKSAQNNGNELTCVYCRARWAVPGPASGSGIKRGGYLNLANVAGVNPVRDTSTCKLPSIKNYYF